MDHRPKHQGKNNKNLEEKSSLQPWARQRTLEQKRTNHNTNRIS